MAEPNPLIAQRSLVARMLSASPVDAVASYFALEHDPKRTRLTVRTDTAGRAIAFVAVCQTGLDLFRPLVIFRGEDDSALQDATREALQPRRNYLFNALPSLRPVLESVVTFQSEGIQSLYTLNRADFQPIVNILVQNSRTPDGQLRATVKTREGNTAAEAGTAWISSRYAEVFVSVIDGARGRGLGKSVVSAVCSAVLQMNRTPLYIVDPDNFASVRLAQRLGFHNTSAHELSGAVTLRD
jgi:GNAT superfamily N-acetyltransferase